MHKKIQGEVQESPVKKKKLFITGMIESVSILLVTLQNMLSGTVSTAFEGKTHAFPNTFWSPLNLQIWIFFQKISFTDGICNLFFLNFFRTLCLHIW